MPTKSKNTRRSASSVGLNSNITYPVADSSISDSNTDGSDLRHIAGIYRGETIFNPIGGGTTIISAASFGLEISLFSANNLVKSTRLVSNTDLSSQFAQTLTKSTTTTISADLSSSFNNTLAKTSSVSLGIDLSSKFSGLSSVVLTAPQISFSLLQSLSANPTLLTLLNAPKIYLSVQSDLQLSSQIAKSTTILLSSELNSQFVPNLAKITNANLSAELSSQFTPTSTKTLTGLNLAVELNSNFASSSLKSNSVVLSTDFAAQFGQPAVVKTTSLGLGFTQGVFISGYSQSILGHASFGIDLCSQFTAVAPSILDNNPSTYCFTFFINKDIDINMYINKTTEFNLNLKNRC
jgi:hypothetical protein